jgi:uncharacterized protein YbjT (DUF2867 family)
MILVTGATGKVGQELVRRLSEARTPFRALVRSAGKAERIREAGGEAVVGDFADDGVVATALRGADRLFLLTNSVPEQPAVEGRLVELAKAAGVRHVVKLSSSGADAADPPLFLKLHRDAERAIEGSGLAWTFVRPNFFMQNYLDYAGAIRTQGILASTSGAGRHADVDARDIGEVAARVLTQPGHEDRAYEVTGREAYSFEDVARRIAQISGRDVRFVRLSREDGRRQLLTSGESEWSADAWIELLDWFDRGQGDAAAPDAERILGRPPRTLDAFLREHVREFGA